MLWPSCGLCGVFCVTLMMMAESMAFKSLVSSNKLDSTPLVSQEAFLDCLCQESLKILPKYYYTSPAETFLKSYRPAKSFKKFF